ncbi:MAG: hypothetical protein ACOCVF_02635 [bacterium]
MNKIEDIKIYSDKYSFLDNLVYHLYRKEKKIGMNLIVFIYSQGTNSVNKYYKKAKELIRLYKIQKIKGSINDIKS